MTVPVIDKTPAAGLRSAEALSRRLDRPMGLLGVVFPFVVLQVSRPARVMRVMHPFRRGSRKQVSRTPTLEPDRLAHRPHRRGRARGRPAVLHVRAASQLRRRPLQAALATITGGGIAVQDPFSRILHMALALHSVAVFATLAGSLGAFLLRGDAARG